MSPATQQGGACVRVSRETVLREMPGQVTSGKMGLCVTLLSTPSAYHPSTHLSIHASSVYLFIVYQLPIHLSLSSIIYVSSKYLRIYLSIIYLPSYHLCIIYVSIYLSSIIYLSMN